MSPEELCIEVGQQLIWLRTTARGYGFQERIPVTVVGINKSTIKVEATLAKGGTKLVNVRKHNLARRWEVSGDQITAKN